MLKLLGQNILLLQQMVLFFDQVLHPVDCLLQNRGQRRRGDGLCQSVGETGEELDVVQVEIVLHVTGNLQHAKSSLVTFDDNIDDRDDAVQGVKRRQLEILVFTQVLADRWLPGHEGSALRRVLVGKRDDLTDDALRPAAGGFNQKIVLIGAISAYVAERRTEDLGADPRGFIQDIHEVALAQRKATEARDRRLLAQKIAEIGGGLVHSNRGLVHFHRGLIHFRGGLIHLHRGLIHFRGGLNCLHALLRTVGEGST